MTENTTASFTLALAQINLAVGDIIGNTRRLCDLLRQADNRGVDAILFPELSVCGYPPQDLLLRHDFLDACEKAVEEIRDFTQGKNIAVIFGTPEQADSAVYNTALVIRAGQILHKHRKHKLPNYGVFDEKRWFQSGTETSCYRHDLGNGQAVHLGISVCEDIWDEAQPVQQQIAKGAELLLNLSASPFAAGKRQQRLKMLQDHAKNWQRPIAYCNLVGAQDGLVFDGSSPCLDAQGRVVGQCPPFTEALLTTRWQKAGNETHWQATESDVIQFNRPAFLRHRPWRVENQYDNKDTDLAEKYAAIALALHDYFSKSGFEQAYIGLSGGIDSALTAAIATQVLGRENVIGVLMPSRYSSDHSLKDARDLADNLGMATRTIPIEPVFQAYLDSLSAAFADMPADPTEENLQARIRGNLLMALANKHGSLVLATGNKSELAVGYSTLYGDMAGAFAPLKDLYKTDVFRLARWLNASAEKPLIPPNSIEKPPSAELRPDQKDSDSLPDYAVLDAILKQLIEEKKGLRSIIEQGFDAETVYRVAQLLRVNEHKRFQAPPGPRLSNQAFDADRRMPISHAFDWRLW